MSIIKEDLYYSEEHEWVSVEGNVAMVGVTDYAQDSMGDIVFVELPEEDSIIQSGDPVGVLESVKAVSDVYTPVSGKVVEINDALESEPELINADPYANHIFSVELDNKEQLENLMDADSYAKYCDQI